MNKFQLQQFDISDLLDPFFDTLKLDYPEFNDWFAKKAESGEKAYIYRETEIRAFLYLKNEFGDKKEEIILDNGKMPAEERIKIGTLKLFESVQGLRLGEGAIGMVLLRYT